MSVGRVTGFVEVGSAWIAFLARLLPVFPLTALDAATSATTPDAAAPATVPDASTSVPRLLQMVVLGVGALRPLMTLKEGTGGAAARAACEHAGNSVALLAAGRCLPALEANEVSAARVTAAVAVVESTNQSLVLLLLLL